jgi:hypothetical protein
MDSTTEPYRWAVDIATRMSTNWRRYPQFEAGQGGILVVALLLHAAGIVASMISPS